MSFTATDRGRERKGERHRTRERACIPIASVRACVCGRARAAVSKSVLKTGKACTRVRTICPAFSLFIITIRRRSILTRIQRDKMFSYTKTRTKKFGQTCRNDSSSHTKASQLRIPQRFGLTYHDDWTKHTVTIRLHIRENLASHNATITNHKDLSTQSTAIWAHIPQRFAPWTRTHGSLMRCIIVFYYIRSQTDNQRYTSKRRLIRSLLTNQRMELHNIILFHTLHYIKQCHTLQYIILCHIMLCQTVILCHIMHVKLYHTNHWHYTTSSYVHRRTLLVDLI